jgi:3-methyladenine DNA glycosylase AlkD
VAADTALIAAVRAALEARADPARAKGQQAYMKSAMPYRGLTAPALRAALRNVFVAHPITERATWTATVRELWDEATYREERYAAIGLVRHPAHHAWARERAVIPLLRHLIVTGAWWDYVDDLATHCVGPILAAHPQEAGRIRAWATDDDMWLRRTAILAQLIFAADTDRQLLLDCIEPNLLDREFFIRKAIGWALRQFARTDPNWVAAVVADWADRLSPLSRREALKHLTR